MRHAIAQAIAQNEADHGIGQQIRVYRYAVHYHGNYCGDRLTLLQQDAEVTSRHADQVTGKPGPITGSREATELAGVLVLPVGVTAKAEISQDGEPMLYIRGTNYEGWAGYTADQIARGAVGYDIPGAVYRPV